MMTRYPSLWCRRYRRLALKYHPEADCTHEGQQEFLRVCEAYDVLSNGKQHDI
jgi:DnaJ-class molecular chaperone